MKENGTKFMKMNYLVQQESFNTRPLKVFRLLVFEVLQHNWYFDVGVSQPFNMYQVELEQSYQQHCSWVNHVLKRSVIPATLFLGKPCVLSFKLNDGLHDKYTPNQADISNVG